MIVVVATEALLAVGVTWTVLAIRNTTTGARLVGDVEVGPIWAQITSIVVERVAEEAFIAYHLIDALIIEQISAEVATQDSAR